MKQRIAAVVISVATVAALSLAGYWILSFAPLFSNPSGRPIENPESIYASAVKKIDQNTDTVLQISHTQQFTVDASSFLEISNQTISFDRKPNGDTVTQSVQTIQSGTHSIRISEIFSNNILYLQVNDIPFMSTCQLSQYEKSLIPAVILTPNQYKMIQGTDNGSGYTISFSQPVGIEAWVSDGPVTFLDARGTAHIGYDGTLTESMYTVSYEQNNVTFQTTTLVNIAHADVDISLPEDDAEYAEIAYWEGPKALERACGFLLQADRITASYNDSIYFQAIGDRRTQSIAIQADKGSVSVSTTQCLTNDTKQDQQTTYTKNELFTDGQYSVAINGDAPTVNADITVDDMYNYFQDQLVSTIMLPEYIHSADVTQSQQTLRIDFTGTDAFGSFLAQNACQILYPNQSLITDPAEQISTEALLCYLEIDRHTGLPLASGINYTGNYYAQELPYRLQYDAEQSYALPSREEPAATQSQQAIG